MNFDDCIKKGLVKKTTENKAISNSLVNDILLIINTLKDLLEENVTKNQEMSSNNTDLTKK